MPFGDIDHRPAVPEVEIPRRFFSYHIVTRDCNNILMERGKRNWNSYVCVLEDALKRTERLFLERDGDIILEVFVDGDLYSVLSSYLEIVDHHFEVIINL